MLVVTTMLTSIANDLPRTAGIKYIDIWMLFCLLIPVMEIILHTIEDHFIRKYRDYVHFSVVLSCLCSEWHHKRTESFRKVVLTIS